MKSDVKPTANTVKKQYQDLREMLPGELSPRELLLSMANTPAAIEAMGEKYAEHDAEQLRKGLVEMAKLLDSMEQWSAPGKPSGKRQNDSQSISNDLDDPAEIRNHKQVKVHVDGASKGNPGPASAGIVVTDLEDIPIYETGVYLGEMTNNAAEYNGLIRALEIIAENGAPAVFAFADSQLMVKQVNQEWRVKHPDMKPLFTRVQHLKRRLPRFQITHVRRELNKRADKLANLAIKQHRDASVM